MIDPYSGLVWPTLCAQVMFLRVGTAGVGLGVAATLESFVTGFVTALCSISDQSVEPLQNPTTLQPIELRARQDSNL